VGLDVGVLCAEELFGAVAGYVFNDIGELAAAVVALGGVAFGVLVGEDGARGFEDGAADEVLGGDHLEALVLAVDLVCYLSGNVGIGGRERCIQIDRHGFILCHGLGVFFRRMWFLYFYWGFWRFSGAGRGDWVVWLWWFAW